MTINPRWSIMLVALLSASALSQTGPGTDETSLNKQRALEFYEQLWFSNQTDRYADFMADTYVAHDIGDRKGVTEPAIEQKNIADFFWDNGTMSGAVDYQIAEGDLVATRWTWQYEPSTLFGRVFLGDTDIPIINVFRFEDGKIVELWNHRHDIDTGMTLRFVLQGFGLGVLVMLVPLFVLRARWRRKALAA